MFKKIYPFAAIVGQEELKLALLLNAVNPKIGGVLIRGEKGTAKSTTVRALAALLPEIRVVAAQRHGRPGGGWNRFQPGRQGRQARRPPRTPGRGQPVDPLCG